MKNNLLFIAFLFLTLTTKAQGVVFNAKGILILFDADTAPSVIVDGKTLKEKGQKDNLLGVKFPLDRNSEESKPLFVSNSMFGSSRLIAVSPKGDLALVIENRGGLADSVSKISNLENSLPNGQFMTAIDISDIQKPISKFKVSVGKNPVSIAFDSSGNNIALLSSEYTKELLLLDIDENGKLSRPISKPNFMTSGRLIDLAWHPSADFLAVINDDVHEVSIIKVMREGARKTPYRMDLVGKPIKVGTKPIFCKFTNDGRFLLILDSPSKPESLEKGKLFAMKVDFLGKNEHILLSSVPTECYSSNFDISTNNNMIVVSNPKTSFFPLNHPNFKAESSISCISLSDDGTLKFENEKIVNGAFVHSVSFDSTSENVLVNVNEYFNFGKKIGGVEFFKVNLEKFTLEKQTNNLIFQKGSHTISVVK